MKTFLCFLILVGVMEGYSSTVLDDISTRVRKLEQLVNNSKTTYRKDMDDLKASTSKAIHNLKLIQWKPSFSFCKNKGCGPCNCVVDYKLQRKYYCDCQNLRPKRDCLAFKEVGLTTNGIYRVTMNNYKTMSVYCDQTTDGGGWTVIQRRVDGTINFYRNWNDYKKGFGYYQHEFYQGNDNIYLLSLQGLYPKGSLLRIEMNDWKGNSTYAKYSSFELGNENSKYELRIGKYAGIAGDMLFPHNKYPFSTYDKDTAKNCAKTFRGAWWYVACHASNLNGEYLLPGQQKPYYGIRWSHWNNNLSLKHVEMKVRRNI